MLKTPIKTIKKHLKTRLTENAKSLKENFARGTIVAIVVLIVVILAVGALVFSYLEKYDIIDSFYYAAVTMTMVGATDVYPKTAAGKIVTMFYVFTGLFVVYIAAHPLSFALKELLTKVKKLEKEK